MTDQLPPPIQAIADRIADGCRNRLEMTLSVTLISMFDGT